jgi:hypothetical protein
MKAAFAVALMFAGGATGVLDAAGPSIKYSDRFPVLHGSTFDGQLVEI